MLHGKLKMLIVLYLFPFFLLTSSSLTWHNITQAVQRGALCNDFSPAGYFIRRNHHISSDSLQPEDIFSVWVIFLESGGGCTSPRSCNERFIEQSVRKQYTQTESLICGRCIILAYYTELDYRRVKVLLYYISCI